MTSSPLRVLTYNVHRWLGTDRRTSPDRVAEVIAACAPDIAALQEVRIHRGKGDGMEPASRIAAQLGMNLFYHPTVKLGDHHFGIAVMSRLPARLVKIGLLPGLRRGPSLEPRAALWVEVEAEGGKLQVIATHLGLVGSERLRQAAMLLDDEWLGHADCAGPAVLMGDLNAGPRTKAYALLRGRLQDAQLICPDPHPRPTFHTRFPILRIDHIMVTPGIRVLSAEARMAPPARIASDHLPLVAEIDPWPRARFAAQPIETSSAL